MSTFLRSLFHTKSYNTLLSDTSEIFEYLNNINDGDNESDGYHLLSLRMYQILDQTTKFLWGLYAYLPFAEKQK